MKNEKIETLSRLYNTLLLISTKGEDTITMADCLRNLYNFIMTEKQALKELSKEIEQEEE